MLAPLAVSASPVIAMTQDTRALTLEVLEQDGAIVVTLIGNAPRAQTVDYTLEVTGNSTSRHRGSTTLTANVEAVLSTIRISTESAWCVRLVATEDGREPYEIVEGNCADQSV
jgi:hypothetical protein